MTDDQEDHKQRRSLQRMQADAMINEGKSAWACPTCGCLDWRVSNVWFSGSNKKRLRKCRNCDTPATSCEVLIPDGFKLEIVKNEE